VLASLCTSSMRSRQRRRDVHSTHVAVASEHDVGQDPDPDPGVVANVWFCAGVQDLQQGQPAGSAAIVRATLSILVPEARTCSRANDFTDCNARCGGSDRHRCPSGHESRPSRARRKGRRERTCGPRPSHASPSDDIADAGGAAPAPVTKPETTGRRRPPSRARARAASTAGYSPDAVLTSSSPWWRRQRISAAAFRSVESSVRLLHGQVEARCPASGGPAPSGPMCWSASSLPDLTHDARALLGQAAASMRVR